MQEFNFNFDGRYEKEPAAKLQRIITESIANLNLTKEQVSETFNDVLRYIEKFQRLNEDIVFDNVVGKGN